MQNKIQKLEAIAIKSRKCSDDIKKVYTRNCYGQKAKCKESKITFELASFHKKNWMTALETKLFTFRKHLTTNSSRKMNHVESKQKK